MSDVPAFDLVATDPWPAADPPAAAALLYNPLTTVLSVTITAPLSDNATDGHAAAMAGGYEVADTAVTPPQSWGPATVVSLDGGRTGLQVTGKVPSDYAVVLEFRKKKKKKASAETVAV